MKIGSLYGNILKVRRIKIFLYYKFGLTIKEIANSLNKNESYIKHLIYRTLHELQDKFGNGGNNNDK